MKTQTEERMLTYETLAGTTPADHEPMRALLKRLRDEQQGLDAAIEREQANTAAADGDDPTARRVAQRYRQEFRDAVEDAQFALKQTRRELDEARRAICAAAAPVIQGERQRHLPRVRAALIELEAAAAALRAVESIAGDFELPSSFGDFILAETQRLRFALKQHAG